MKTLESLSDRERDVLRLLARGHDAKSIACTLEISVHAVNERLRETRRKLGVSSSREAARMLLARESASPNSYGPKEIVIDPPPLDGVSRQPFTRAPYAIRPLTLALL